MEKYFKFGGRIGSFCIFFGISLLLHFAHAKYENETEPTANVNIGPIMKWRSAYFCLKHKAVEGACANWGPSMGILTPKGKLNVSRQALDDYCGARNCADQIRFNVLSCIHFVHDKFMFHNNATIQYVNDTITTRCALRDKDLIIDQVAKKSGGINANQKTYVSVVSALLVFLAIFKM